MNHRLNQETREETEAEISITETHDEVLAFETADAAIRHDAQATEVPSALRERVMQSVSRETPPQSRAPWWKRWSPF